MTETTTEETKINTSEIEALRIENSELTAVLQETNMRVLDLIGQLAAANAELKEIKANLKTDTGNQEIILKKIEKLNSAINEKSETVDVIPAGLSAEEVEAVRVARQDKIEQLKAEKQNLRNLLGVN